MIGAAVVGFPCKLACKNYIDESLLLVYFLLYLAGVNEFIFALFVAQKDGALAWKNFHVQAVFTSLAQLRLTWRPRQVIGLDGEEFFVGAPSPHSFASLRTAHPIIQISFPRCYTRKINHGLAGDKKCFSYCR